MDILIPTWEHPLRRFLDGVAEVQSADAQACPFTLWEALLHVSQADYPLRYGQIELHRADLEFAAVDAFLAGQTGEIQERLGAERFAELVRGLSSGAWELASQASDLIAAIPRSGSASML